MYAMQHKYAMQHRYAMQHMYVCRQRCIDRFGHHHRRMQCIGHVTHESFVLTSHSIPLLWLLFAFLCYGFSLPSLFALDSITKAINTLAAAHTVCITLCNSV